MFTIEQHNMYIVTLRKHLANTVHMMTLSIQCTVVYTVYGTSVYTLYTVHIAALNVARASQIM